MPLSLIPAYAGAVVFSAIDPVWATPLNTMLLLLVAVFGYLTKQRLQRVEDKTHEIHADVGHAASAAAAAAQAAADAARVTKELGGAQRHVEPMPPAPES